MTSILPINLRRDLPKILAMEQTIFGEDAFPLSEFLYLYMRGKNLFFVGYQGDICVGYISAYCDAQQAYIASIAVDEAYRRRGIGQQFIATIIKQLQTLDNIKTLNLHVRQSNHAAIQLYHSLGFERIGEAHDYYLDEDAYIMALSIKES